MTSADDTPTTRDKYRAGTGWRKLGVLLLALAAVGLPVNDFYVYALLVILIVIVFTGDIRSDPRAWLAAIAIVSIALLDKFGWRRRASTRAITYFCRADQRKH